MKKTWKQMLSKTLLLSTITLAAFTPSALGATTAELEPSHIQVTGEAQQVVAPTYALLTLGTSSQNTDLSVAKANSDKIMSELLTKLAALGIEKKDIRSSNVSIRPNYSMENNKRVNNGYNLTNQIFIRINNLNNVNKVINTAVSIGINDISSLRFNSDVSQQVEDQLTTDAIRDGRHQAEVMASALGRSLGPVKSISLYQTRTTPVQYDYNTRPTKEQVTSSTNTTEGGSVTINKSASMSYYLK